MTTSSRPAVFIEKIFPVKLLNEQVYYEHGGNPFKGLHRWYSRKPLSFSRASVLGSILPAEISIEEFEYLLGLFSEQEFEFWRSKGLAKEDLEKIRDSGKVKLYKTPPTPRQMQRVHDLCEQVWGKRTPAVLDAFAGGGSIPFEAARYGLEVFASDLNPVAVVTMKAAIEFPLQFGPALQGDIDRWVQWVGDEAEKRLAEFFPSQEGETIQNYLWAHTVKCPHCSSTVPLSPNWWLSKTSNYAGKGQARKVTSDWYAVKPIPNPAEKRVNFELIKGKKGKGNTIQTPDGDYNPDDFSTISRGVAKCPNCKTVIENDYIASPSGKDKLGHQFYAVAFKKEKGSLEFRTPTTIDIEGFEKADNYLEKNLFQWESQGLIGHEETPLNPQYSMIRNYGLTEWHQCFNSRQLLTLLTYVEIINEVKEKIRAELGEEKLQAIATYLTLVLSRCVDASCRLAHWSSTTSQIQLASGQHALNLMWNYPEPSGINRLWGWCVDVIAKKYTDLCELLGTRINSSSLNLENYTEKNFQIDSACADSLFHLADQSIDAVVTDPPYYGTIPYADLSDFFYIWNRKILGDIFPELYYRELTDKDREAVANPSRFRDMGASPKELADRDYEAKMQMAFSEYYRVLKNDGVMTVQFNHKDSGAWDVLAQSLITAGFEITASWAVSTENPQNLHQAQKNSVSSTVLLVCRKRDPNAPQAWWDDLRPEVANLVEQRAPEFEANDITGIDLYLSAFGPALNVFSRSYPILDNSGAEVRPEVAFAEARKAIANYRFQKLVQTDTAGFDPLTQWYLLAWDAFKAREFPFDEARQLALAIGGFNINDLTKTHWLIDAKSGSCTLMTPQQRLKKRAFSTNPQDFSATHLINALHAVLAIYEDEENIMAVRQFLQKTGLVSNDYFIKTLAIALQVIPSKVKEKEILTNLWLGLEEIKAKVVYQQTQLF
jgi:adenine-specific DNA methylase